MTAIRTADGKWAVVSGEAMQAGPFDTSAEAWRWIDRHTGQPISGSECRADFAWQKNIDRSFGA